MSSKEPIWQCTCTKVMGEPIVSTTRPHKTSVELPLQRLPGYDEPLTLLINVEYRISQILYVMLVHSNTCPPKTGQQPTHRRVSEAAATVPEGGPQGCRQHASESPSLPNQALASKDNFTRRSHCPQGLPAAVLTNVSSLMCKKLWVNPMRGGSQILRSRHTPCQPIDCRVQCGSTQSRGRGRLAAPPCLAKSDTCPIRVKEMGYTAAATCLLQQQQGCSDCEAADLQAKQYLSGIHSNGQLSNI